MRDATWAQPSRLLPVLLLASLAILPFAAIAAGQPFWISFFARMMIYAIAASALNLALGYGGLVSFGHALFFGLGSYAVALPAALGIGDGWVHVGVCVLFTGVAAFVTGIISLRTSGIAFIMITLAFAQLGYFFFVSLKNFGGDDGLAILQTSRFGRIDLGLPTHAYGAAFILLVMLTWWLARLRASPFGMVLRGAQQNARRVNAIGFQVLRYQLAAFVISGILCGLAGLLLANLNAYASPSSMTWLVSGELIVMVVLGGMGSVFGPLLGAMSYLGMEEILKSVTDHWMAVFGPLIVAFALLGKRGIVSLLERLDRPGRPVSLAADVARVPVVEPASAPQ